MADFTTPQPLQALLVDASQAPWLNEKDEAAASWDEASLPDRQSVAAWVRTWSEGDEIARVKEVMVGVDARIEAAKVVLLLVAATPLEVGHTVRAPPFARRHSPDLSARHPAG